MFNNSCVKLTEIIDCPKNATHYFNCSEIFTTMGTGLYTIDLKCKKKFVNWPQIFCSELFMPVAFCCT